MSPRLASTGITVHEINYDGAIAQLGERLPCTQEVCGSIPHSSTIFLLRKTRKLQSEPEKVHCEVLLFKNLDQAEN
ncbi:protein of unknown function [Enterobacter cancerogenus]|nr:protein of unknown function [Enterobacter cancerogenus]